MQEDTSAQNTQRILRESVRRAKNKLSEAHSLSTHGADPYQHFDTFNVHGSTLLRKVKEMCHSGEDASQTDRYAKPIKTESDISLMKEENSRLRQQVATLEQQIAQQSSQLAGLEQSLRLVTSDLLAQRQSNESLGEDMRRQAAVKDKILDKYKQQVSTLRQDKQQADNYCRQLANEYALLLNSRGNKDQEERNEVAQYRKKIESLSKELATIKQLLLKDSKPSLSDRVPSRREEELSEGNIQLQAKVKNLKIEVGRLKTLLANQQKELHHLKAEEKARESRLQHYERKNEVLMNEAARNGLTVSYGRLHHGKASEEPRPERKKSRCSTSKGRDNKENHTTALNKRKLTLM